MSIQQIPKNNVSEIVFQQIKQAITSGEWKQGEKIPSENEFAKKMGVSRMTVRGALQRLSTLGIVESRQGEGTFVCELNGGQYINSIIPLVTLERQDVFYMFEFRRILECEAAALAASRATPASIKALKDNYDMMATLDAFSKECSLIDMQFHFEIARITQNPMLIQVFGILQDVFLKSIEKVSHIMAENNALLYHSAIIEAIDKRDAAEAKRLMAEHLDSTMNLLRQEE